MLTTPIREGAYYMTKARGVVGPMCLHPYPKGDHSWTNGNLLWNDHGERWARDDGDAWDLQYECDAQGNRIGDSWQITGGSPAIACKDDTTVLGTCTTAKRKGYVGIYRSKSTGGITPSSVCPTRASAESRYGERWSLITVLEFDLPEDAP